MNHKRYTALPALALFVAAPALTAGCDSSVFEVDVNLQRQVYSADFGNAQGTIPAVPCDPAGPDVCGASAGAVPVESGSATGNIQLACDGTTQRCFAQSRVAWNNPIDVLQDNDFVSKVERHSVAAVRQVDLAYVVPANTLTFEVPAIRIFVGPAGSVTEADAGVVSVGDTEPVAAGATIAESAPRHLVVVDGSPAHTFIEKSILTKQTMVFILVLAPRVDAGAPIPAGALEVALLPRLTLGLPR